MSLLFCLIRATYAFLIDCKVVAWILFFSFLEKSLAAAAMPC